MDAEERAAAANAAASAVSELNSTVEQVSRQIRQRARSGLSVLGPAGTAPMAAVDAGHMGVHAAIRAAASMAGPVTGEALRATTPGDAQSLIRDPRHANPVSWLGAAFGDRLPESLAPSMTLRIGPQPDSDVASPACPKIAVFLHGLGGHDRQWGPEYGNVMGVAGFTPVFVRYTTGRPLVDSGAEFAALMHALTSEWPVPVTRIVLVGHSMGGLVVASALAQAAREAAWPGLTTDVVTLGTPHKGAPLERISDRALRLMARWPTAAPIAELGQRRSQGIKDLAHGVDDPFPRAIHHHAVVGHVGGHRGKLSSMIFGDGMVGPASAAGHAPDSDSVTVIELPRTSHLTLLDHPDVTTLLSTIAEALR